MANTDRVRVKINGVFDGKDREEFSVCGVLFTDRKIKTDKSVSSTLVSLRKDLVSSTVITWGFNRLDFKTIKVSENEYVTEFRCEEDYYEVLQYNSEDGLSKDAEKMYR